MNDDRTYADLAFEIGHLLRQQLDANDYRVRVDTSTSVPERDATVRVVAAINGNDGPLPLVVDIASGDAEADAARIRRFQERGDEEIWQVDNATYTVNTWRRLGDEDGNGYNEMSYHAADVIYSTTLLGLRLDLHHIFDSGI